MSAEQNQSTREVILQAAIALFGQKGFEATTTREIAKAANVNLGSLKYYFDNKDGLYAEVIQELIRFISPLVNQIEAMLTQGKQLAGDDPQRQAALVSNMVTQAIDTFLGSPRIRTLLPLVIRELTTPSSHFDEFYDVVPRRLHEAITGIVSWVEKTDPEDCRTIIRAHSLVGEIVVFHIGRFILEKRLGMDGLDADTIAIIKAEVSDFVLTGLQLPRGGST